MGVLKNLAQGDANTAHDMLKGGISLGMNKTHAMTAAIVVTQQDKSKVLLRETMNFSGSQHAELQAMSRLFPLTQSLGTPWVLPANARVYIYVYDSPCIKCVERLRFSLKNAWLAGGRNSTVTWKLGFSRWYVGQKDNYATSQAAAQAYDTHLVPLGLQWSLVPAPQ